MKKKISIAALTNLQAVERYILKQDIVLTDEQQDLSLRIQFADEKKRTRIHDTAEIINLIVGRFGVSKWRAEQDITDAQQLFGKTRKLNKNYLLAQHLDKIEKQIQVATTSRQFAVLPKLNDNYTHALNSLEPEQLGGESSPTTIIFIVKHGDMHKKKSADEWLKEAEASLLEDAPEIEDIDYEESTE